MNVLGHHYLPDSSSVGKIPGVLHCLVSVRSKGTELNTEYLAFQIDRHCSVSYVGREDNGKDKVCANQAKVEVARFE
jgi:hypothetical protein